jgi:hypothetical protein
MQTANHIAFKEWAVGCAALGAGRQTIILRKGGIDEGREGFHVEHGEFWLLPTRFHQAADQLQPEAEPLWREVREQAPPPGKFLVALYAKVDKVFAVQELDLFEHLRGEHILSDATIEQRFHYRHTGLFVLAVRVFRVAKCHEIDDSPYIAGCKSWVELPAPLSTAGATAVLDDAIFAKRLQTIERLLKSQPSI